MPVVRSEHNEIGWREYPPLGLVNLSFWSRFKRQPRKLLTSVILFVLIIMWVVVLIPPYWKNRTSRGGRSFSIGSFSSSSSTPPNGLQALTAIQQSTVQAHPFPSQDSATHGQGTEGSTVVPFRRPGTPDPSADLHVVGAPAQPAGVAAPQFNNDADMMFGGPERGVALHAPMSLDDARRRRRNVLVGAFTLSAFLLVTAIQWQGIFVLLFLVSLAVSLGFVMVVAQNQRSAEVRSATVAPLRPASYQPQVATAAAPMGYVQQRSAN